MAIRTALVVNNYQDIIGCGVCEWVTIELCGYEAGWLAEPSFYIQHQYTDEMNRMRDETINYLKSQNNNMAVEYAIRPLGPKYQYTLIQSFGFWIINSYSFSKGLYWQQDRGFRGSLAECITKLLPHTGKMVKVSSSTENEVLIIDDDTSVYLTLKYD